MSIKPEHLFLQIEDVIRSMPPEATFYREILENENLSWLGRASAVIRLWDVYKAIPFDMSVKEVNGPRFASKQQGIRGVITMLHQASHELRLTTTGPLTVAVNQGGTYDYFDEVRKLVESAKLDIFFVDPYLDAEFVSRYLPQVSQGVAIRLLGREHMAKLLPAVAALKQQSHHKIEIRSANGFHDRFVFIDGVSCYQSGASFKDGAKKSPTTLTQIVDAFSAMLTTYEQIWASATVQQ